MLEKIKDWMRTPTGARVLEGFFSGVLASSIAVLPELIRRLLH
jgi:hypothetical protein